MMTSPNNNNAVSGNVYTCPMHPEVRSDEPGKCPKCGMFLVPQEPKTAHVDDAGCCSEEEHGATGCCGGGHHDKTEGSCCGGKDKHAHPADHSIAPRQ